MKWQVNLIGDMEDLEDLSKIFSSPDLHIRHEGGGYLLESSSFIQLSDVNTVRDETDRLLTAINATKKLIFSSSTPVERGPIHAVNEGRTTLFLQETISVGSKLRARLTIEKEDGTVDQSPPDNSIKKWIPLIDSDEKIQRVFKLINYDFNTHRGLCNIVEVIQEDHFTPVMRRGEFYDDIDLLKRTAQSYEAIGESARHAHSRFKKPETPMELSTAKDLVIRIVRMWLDSKVPESR